MANVAPLALLLCDRAHVGDDGKVTLEGLCDVVWAASFPARHPRLDVFWRCVLDAPEELRLVVEAPDGTVVADDLIHVSGPGPAQNIHRLADLALPTPGRYRVRLEAAGSPLVTTWFDASSRH